jgi:BirA family biotin operon repressor/biotin-[acetyl-CoA-carboxylase] ligase
MLVAECTSTNDLAATQADQGAPNGFTVIAERQTAGRGREGRQWFSPDGGIWMTTLIRPGRLDEVSALPITAAIATSTATNHVCKVQSRVRWPNDIMLNERKVAGVIVEAKTKGPNLVHALIGTGLNANFQFSRIDPIHDRAISLLDVLGTDISREKLIASILNEMEGLYNTLTSGATETILSLLNQNDWSIGRHVRVKTGSNEVVGVVDGYESLSKTRIRTPKGFEIIETSSVVSVEYESN